MAVIDGFNINGTSYDIRDDAAVRFDEAQTLTAAQKAQARTNIGAASQSDVTELENSVDDIADIIGADESETVISTLDNSDFARKSRFLLGTDTAYPYFGSHRSFVTYENFDIPVTYGNKYRVKVTVPSQYSDDANMMVVTYNQALVNAYNSRISANTTANVNTNGGWGELERVITVPNATNGDPCVGLLVSVRRSADLPTIEDDFVITSVVISEIISGASDCEVVRYDVAQNKTEAEKALARANLGITHSQNEYVTPQMYGAKGDGVTDDTAAFQAAINAGRNIFVPLSNGQRYLITDTLVFSKQRQFIYGDIYAPDWAYYASSSLNGCIYFNKNNSILFDFQFTLQGCSNLSIFTDEGSNNTAIRFKKNSDITNIDGSVLSCSIRNFNIAVDHYGRGLSFKRNVVVSCGTVIRTTIVNEPRWDHDNPTSAELFQTYPEYNGRSLFMVDNRFHLTSSRYLLVLSEDYVSGSTTIKQVLNGAVIIGNMGDLGLGSFEFNAPIKGCVFSNNEFLRISPDVFFDCKEGASDCTFASNTIRGLADSNYPQVIAYGKDCFAFNGLEYTSISGNVIETFKQRCIYCYGNGFNHNTITGNIFRKYGIDTSVAQYQRTGFDIPDSEYSIIASNTFDTPSSVNGYLIRARDPSTNVWKHNIFNGNTFVKQNAQEVLIPTTEGTEDNVIQGTT